MINSYNLTKIYTKQHLLFSLFHIISWLRVGGQILKDLKQP